MGGGKLLEQGTHAELLQDVNGPYARLVHAQKLREQKEKEESTLDDLEHTTGAASPETQAGLSLAAHDSEKLVADDDFVYKRTMTQKSMTSDLLVEGDKAKDGSDKYEARYGGMELIKRLATIR